MRIYHGANRIVQSPKFGIGRAYNDFGLGFYCTQSEDRAAEWAVSSGNNGFVSVYAFDDSGLRVTDLSSSQFTVLHWLSVLINYREFDSFSGLLHQAKEYISMNFPVDFQSSDCISGYRADDISFLLAQLFLNGEISFQTLKAHLTEDDPGRQYVLKSNRAFDRISYIGYITADHTDIHPVAASREIRDLTSALQKDDHSGLFINKMIAENIKAYDPRIQ